MVIHAELNAVLNTGSMARDGTLYVVGKPVCSKCAGGFIQRGVRRIIAKQPENNNTTWNRLGKQALQMLREAGVEVEFVDLRPRPSQDASGGRCRSFVILLMGVPFLIPMLASAGTYIQCEFTGGIKTSLTLELETEGEAISGISIAAPNWGAMQGCSTLSSWAG